MEYMSMVQIFKQDSYADQATQLTIYVYGYNHKVCEGYKESIRSQQDPKYDLFIGKIAEKYDDDKDADIDKIELKYELVLLFQDSISMKTCYKHLNKIITAH